MMTVYKIKDIFRGVFSDIGEHNVSDAAAALAFHSLLAIIPTAVITVIVTGFIVGRGTVEVIFFSFLERTFGTEVVLLERAVEGTFDMMTNFIFSAVVLLVAVWAFVGLVDHVRKVFFSIFGIDVKGTGGIERTLRSRFISFLYTTIVLTLVVSLIIGQALVSILFGSFGGVAERFVPPVFMEAIQLTVFFGVVFTIFGLLYRFMSAGTLYWRSVATGSALSAFLFTFFNSLLFLYTAHSATLGFFGASSFLVLLLVWVYYSAFTLFLGGIVAQRADKYYRHKKKKETVYI